MRGLLSEMRYSFSRNAHGDIIPPIFMPHVSSLRAGLELGDDDDDGDGVMHSEADGRRDAGSERFMALSSSSSSSSSSPSSLIESDACDFF